MTAVSSSYSIFRTCHQQPPPSPHPPLPPSAGEPADEAPVVPAYISERYKVGRMLGDGNFAVVHECSEHSTGRQYALKIINKGKCRGKVRDRRRGGTWSLDLMQLEAAGGGV